MSKTSERSPYEIKQLSEWWLSLSKIILGSLVIKLFEPGEVVTLKSLLVASVGLTVGLVFATVGLKLAHQVKE